MNHNHSEPTYRSHFGLRQRTSEFQDVIQITLLHFEFKKMLNATK